MDDISEDTRSGTDTEVVTQRHIEISAKENTKTNTIWPKSGYTGLTTPSRSETIVPINKELLVGASAERSTESTYQGKEQQTIDTYTPKSTRTDFPLKRQKDISIKKADFSQGRNPNYRDSKGIYWLISLILMLIVVLIAILVSFYLYKSRYSPPFSSAAKISQEAEKSIQTLVSYVEKLNQRNADISEEVSTIREISVTLRRIISEKDEEIQWLKKGYDLAIFKKFLYRFIRVDQALKKCQLNQEYDKQRLGDVISLLEDAFAECGVERFSPEIGEDYRKTKGVANNPKRIASPSPKEAYKITKVLEEGYRVKTPEGYDIIYEARVEIYSAKKE